MNRTPRSASRRASRQLLAKLPSPGLAPYRSSTDLGSFETSTNPGPQACILNAISYWAMREAFGCFWPERPVDTSTRKPGRLSVSAPSPYQHHEPLLGRPEIVVPVFM